MYAIFSFYKINNVMICELFLRQYLKYTPSPFCLGYSWHFLPHRLCKATTSGSSISDRGALRAHQINCCLSSGLLNKEQTKQFYCRASSKRTLLSKVSLLMHLNLNNFIRLIWPKCANISAAKIKMCYPHECIWYNML